HLQERVVSFIPSGARVYEGMVVVEYSRAVDLNVNISREKKLTNIRAAGRDENVIITPHREMGLENGIEWIADDELVEVTPQSVRLRKKILRQVERPKRRHVDIPTDPPGSVGPASPRDRKSTRLNSSHQI